MTTTDTTKLDALTRELTAFDSFEAMLNAAGNYRPSIYPRDYKHVELAEAYDVAQAARGDERRAYRGLGWPLPEPILSARLTSMCPHNKRSHECCGNPEWLQVIQVIHSMQRPDPQNPDKNWIGDPLFMHDWWAGGWCEEYRDFRVILQHEQNTNYVQARTPEAADALRAAFLAVTGHELHNTGDIGHA